MEDLDLSEIEPLKWAEVRRRAAAVREYLALENPSAADRERFAATLDLGALQFSNLVRAWSAHQDATALAPGMHRARPSRSRKDGVDPVAREIARAAITELGPKASLSELTERIESRCRTANVLPPSRGTVWLLSVEARGRDGGSVPQGVVVARAHLRLPVKMGSKVVFPEVVIAAETPTGRVLDIVLVRPVGDFDARRVAEAITRHAVPHLPILAADENSDALGRYLPPSVSIKVITALDAKRELSMALGKRIGLVPITFRPPSVRPSTVMKSGRDRAPNVEDAELALHIARHRHNAELEMAA